MTVVAHAFRHLSMIAHPDKGGKVDNFTFLLSVRDELKNNKSEYDNFLKKRDILP